MHPTQSARRSNRDLAASTLPNDPNEPLEDLHAAVLADQEARLSALEGRVQVILEAGNALSVRDLAVNGHDLMSEVGVAPGPKLGSILTTLLEEVVEDPSRNERETLLARARQLSEEA